MDVSLPDNTPSLQPTPSRSRKFLEDTEEWKQLPICKFYQVNRQGDVRNNYGKILTPIDHNGYNTVVIYFDKTSKKIMRVHRIVAMTFLENPDNKTQVNHKDGNKKNNKVENLEWCSPKENMQHFWSQPNASLKKRPVRFTKGTEVHNFKSLADASRHFGVALSTIWSATFTGRWKGYKIEEVVEQSVDKQPLLESVETEGGHTINCRRI